MKFFFGVFIVLMIYGVGTAQEAIPHVDKIVEQFDADGDGWISLAEIANSKKYAQRFSQWDIDGDGKVSAAEITKLRAKFGVAADGTRQPRKALQGSESPAFVVPDIAEMVRLDGKTKLTREQSSNSQFILGTTAHQVAGENYVILTDHKEEAYLEPLRELAEHRQGQLVKIDDLVALAEEQSLQDDLLKQLRAAQPKYVAIAPRLVSFSENTMLAVWTLLATIDDDPQLDCLPGWLVASDADSFARLIKQSIAHQPIKNSDVRPFAISQVNNSRETRSLQKSGVLRKHFQKANLETPILAIYGATADSAPRLPGDKVWNLKVDKRRDFVKDFPEEVDAELAAANLIVMHGHGIPGMSCSVDVDGIPADCSGKILLSGSCFSASPAKSDLPKMNQAPGGYEVQQRDAFVIRAIDNGAIAAFGHQRLSSGFPHLYPVLEGWVDGKSIGQAYQELMNALILKSKISPEQFVINKQDRGKRRVLQNVLLYVVIGDPALVPFESQQLLKRQP